MVPRQLSSATEKLADRTVPHDTLCMLDGRGHFYSTVEGMIKGYGENLSGLGDEMGHGGRGERQADL